MTLKKYKIGHCGAFIIKNIDILTTQYRVFALVHSLNNLFRIQFLKNKNHRI